MAALSDILLVEPARSAVIADCVSAIEAHVAGRGGLKGLGMKAGLAMLKTAKPDILLRAVNRLLPDIAASLEPQYKKSGGDAAQFHALLLRERESLIAGLLQLGDARVAASDNASVKSIYARIRGNAETELAMVFPALSEALSRPLARV